MSERELSYTERKSLLGFARHLDRLRSRIAHKKDQTRQDEVILFVLDKSINQIRAFIQGKALSLEPPVQEAPKPPPARARTRSGKLIQFITEEGEEFERRYAANSPIALEELREHFEKLKKQLDEEFGADSPPSRIVGTAISELSGRVRQILTRLKRRR